MKKSIVSLALLMLIVTLRAISSTSAGGNWSDPNTWTNGILPQANDDVVIDGPVTINTNQSCGSVLIQQGKSLMGAAFLNVAADFTNLGIYTNGSTTYIGGNITQNGPLWQSGEIYLTSNSDVLLTTQFPINSTSFHCAYNAPLKRVKLQGDLRLVKTAFYLDGCELVATPQAEINLEDGYFLGGDNEIIDINQSLVFNFKRAYLGNLTLQGDVVLKGNVASAGFNIIGNVVVNDTLSPHSYGTTGYGGDLVNVTGSLTNNGLIRGNVLKDGSNNMRLTVNVDGNFINNSTLCNQINSATGIFTNNGLIRNTDIINVGTQLINNGSIIDGSNNYGDGSNYKTVIVFLGDKSFEFSSTPSGVMQKCQIKFDTPYSVNPRSLTISGSLTADSVRFFNSTHIIKIAPWASVLLRDCQFDDSFLDGLGNTLNFEGKNLFNVKGLKNIIISGKTLVTMPNTIEIDGSVDFSDSLLANIYGNGVVTFLVNGELNNYRALVDTNFYDGFFKKINFVVNGVVTNYGKVGHAVVTINAKGAFNNYGTAKEIFLNGYSSLGSLFYNAGTVNRLAQTQYKGSVVNCGIIEFSQDDYLQFGGHFINKGTLINGKNSQYTFSSSLSGGKNQQIVLANKKSLVVKTQFYSEVSGRWYKDGVLIPNQTSNSSVFSKDSLTINDLGTYHCYKASGNLTSAKFIVDTLFHTENIAPLENQTITSADVEFKWLPIPGATEYRLQLATDKDFTQSVESINQIYDTTYTHPKLAHNSTWYWRVSARTAYGFVSREYKWTAYTTASSFVFTGSGVDEEDGKIFALSQNYPNPFNPSTAITFSLTKKENVKLSIYNAKGEFVKELLNSTLSAGSHTVNFKAENLNSGLYFYQLTNSGETITKKMVLSK